MLFTAVLLRGSTERLNDRSFMHIQRERRALDEIVLELTSERPTHHAIEGDIFELMGSGVRYRISILLIVLERMRACLFDSI